MDILSRNKTIVFVTFNPLNDEFLLFSECIKRMEEEEKEQTEKDPVCKKTHSCPNLSATSKI